MELVVLTLSTLAHLVVGTFILLKDRQSYTNRFFWAFTVFSAVWGISNYFSLHQTNPEASLGSIRIVMFFAVYYSLTLFLTIHTFPSRTILLKRWLFIFVALGSVIVSILTQTSLIFSGIEGSGSNATPIAGSGIFLFALTTGSLILSSIIMLISRYIKSRNTLRAQLKMLLIGVTGSALLIFLSNFLLVVVFKFNLLLNFGPSFTLIFIIATAYAITQHGLFNIKVVVAEIGAAAIVLVNFTQLFGSEGAADLVFRLIVFGMVTIFGFLLVRSVQNEVKRREEVEVLAKEKTAALGEVEERNKNLATLQRISDIVLNESEMKTMTQKILDEIPKQLESCAGALLSIVKDSQLVAYALSEHQFGHKILSLVGGDLEKYSHPVKKDFNLIHAVLVDKEPHDSSNLSDFISPPISKAVALTIQKLIGARHIEAFPLYAGGEPFGVLMFVFTDSKDRVYEQNHSIAKAISDDMSLAIQRAQAYQKLKEANAYLADLDKLKDEFISMASHELNTPLAAIEGYLSMVLDEGMGKIDPKAKEYLNRAYDSSKRLAELILDLLNVSRIEQGRLKMKFAKSNFASLVESVIKELQLKADTKKLYLKLETSKTELPETFCDPDRIREVFVNLIGNSIKFTEKGGITIKLSKPDDHIRAEVVDTGRGIAAEDQSKLFQKFSQVKREIDEHQGTGLGLYISKNFVELHKGTIGVKSEVGRGATFFFEIPILRSAPKEVSGAILDKPVNAAQIVADKGSYLSSSGASVQIENGPKGVPEIVEESSKVN